jgi:AcrR family transcriptional regulator
VAPIRPFGELPNFCERCGKVGARSVRDESCCVERINRRERRKEQTLRRIEKAAWTLFTTRGYETTSTREIADAADIAAGTLFNYFPEKRSLLIHLMQRQIDEAATQAFDTIPPSTLHRELTQLFDALTKCYAEERRLSRVFVKELLFTDGEQRAESAAWTFGLVKRIAGRVRDAQRRGELDPTVDPMDAAQQLFSTHYFGLVTWLGGTIPSRAAHEEQFQSSLRLLLRGLRRSAA